MPRPTSKPTSWAQRFDEMEKETGRVVESGFYPATYWMKRLNRSRGQVLKLLAQAVADGDCERKTYLIPMDCGLHHVPHYRIKGLQ